MWSTLMNSCQIRRGRSFSFSSQLPQRGGSAPGVATQPLDGRRSWDVWKLYHAWQNMLSPQVFAKQTQRGGNTMAKWALPSSRSTRWVMSVFLDLKVILNCVKWNHFAWCTFTSLWSTWTEENRIRLIHRGNSPKKQNKRRALLYNTVWITAYSPSRCFTSSHKGPSELRGRGSDVALRLGGY